MHYTQSTYSGDFTFRSSWFRAINRIKSNSVRTRLLTAIVEYANNHTFTLTGNSTIDSMMTIIADQLDTELCRENNFQQPQIPDHPDLSDKSDKSDPSDSSATPNQTRNSKNIPPNESQIRRDDPISPPMNRDVERITSRETDSGSRLCKGVILAAISRTCHTSAS